MKILYDNQIFALQKYGGVSKYFSELIKRMPSESTIVPKSFSNNEYASGIKSFHAYSFFSNHMFRGKERLMVELSKPFTIIPLIKSQYDIFHQTDYNPYCFKYIKKKPVVTTCHDMNFVHANPHPRLASWQLESMKKSTHIVAISNNTKKELMEIWDIPSEKISVIYHGVDNKKCESSVPFIANYPYLLYVGTRYSFKNYNRFLKAFLILKEDFPNLKVISTGNSFNKEESLIINKLGLSDSVFTFSATEDQMQVLYRDALTFVFPSTSEGFGLPLLEAMVQGCPVACSNTTCFPEIAGSVATYFNPLDELDMAQSIKKIISNETYRKEKINEGYQHVSNFTWEKTCQQYLELYKSLI